VVLASTQFNEMFDKAQDNSSTNGNAAVHRSVEKLPLHAVKDGANESADDGAIKLKPKITLINGITVIVGSIIGSGIFISPKGVLQEVHSVGLSLIIWLACGLFSMIGAYCYTELGTSIVRSGADYAYLFEAFGPFLAFLRLWVESMIVRPCSTAVVALTFANYVIEPLFPTCPQPDVAVRLLAVVAISKYCSLSQIKFVR
jgi:amino acid transporter